MGIRARKLVGGLATVGFVISLAILAAPAQAIPVPYNYYKVIDKSTVSTNYTNKADQIASCKAASSGVSCTISKTVSADVSVQLSLGVSRGVVTDGLNITSSSSVSTTVSCTSPKMSKGQTFYAWPRGTRYSYKVVHYESLHAPVTSGTLYAFVPRANAVTCGVS